VAETRHPEWIVGDVPDTGEYNWGLGGLLVDGAAHPWRREGALLWSGAFNQTYVRPPLPVFLVAAALGRWLTEGADPGPQGRRGRHLRHGAGAARRRQMQGADAGVGGARLCAGQAVRPGRVERGVFRGLHEVLGESVGGSFWDLYAAGRGVVICIR